MSHGTPSVQQDNIVTEMLRKARKHYTAFSKKMATLGGIQTHNTLLSREDLPTKLLRQHVQWASQLTSPVGRSSCGGCHGGSNLQGSASYEIGPRESGDDVEGWGPLPL